MGGSQSMKHRLLILGTLGEFVQLVKKAKEQGYYTVVCDGYPDGPARQYADASYVIPVTDIDEVARLCRKENIDGIVTSFSDLLMECMVQIADRAGLPCYLRPEQLRWYRDKSACRELLSKLGLPTPGYVKVPATQKDESTLEAMTEGLRYPLISKPLDKYGSRGIFIIKDKSQLSERVSQTAEFTDLDEILIEEYNDGSEFNMMTWVSDGTVKVISIADREKTQFEDGALPESTRNVYPSRFLDEVEGAATSLLQSYIGYTGQKEGPLSMQFFWKPGEGIQVCEIAARFFGYEHELTDIVYGFNMEELLLNYVYDKARTAQMLEKQDIHKPLVHGAVLYFHGRLLKIQDQYMAYELAQEPAVIKPWIFYEDGEEVIAYGPNPYLALYYIAADSRKKLDEISESFFEKMSMTDPDGKEIVFRNQIEK